MIVARFFQPMNLRQPAAKGKALVGDRAHLRKVAERVEQVQQCSIGSAKLAFEIIRRRLEQFSNPQRILMWARRGDDESDAIFSAAAGAPGHLLQLRGSQ